MQKFFTMRVARHWNGEVVNAPFLEIILRPGWMGLCATLSSGRYPCKWQWYWNQIIFKVFFNSNHPVILIYSEQKMDYILNFPLFFTVHIVTTFKCFIITQMHTQLVLLQCYKKRLSTFLRELRELYMLGTLTCLIQLCCRMRHPIINDGKFIFILSLFKVWHETTFTIFCR